MGAPEEDPDQERAWRRWQVQTLQNNLSGSTGLLRTANAGSSEPGTFRVQFLAGFYSGSGFLCEGQCPPVDGEPGQDDEVSRVAANLTISATLFPFLEAYLGLHSHATSNDQGRPELLQVLGDTNFGVKAFLPHSPEQIFTVGGEAQLWLLNGTGGVGVDGGGTSFALRALATADFNNQAPESKLPLRTHLNLGYHFDNSGKLIEDTERRRGDTPVTRIERFGLDINRVDAFQFGLGVEGTWEVAQPFLEWSIDIPVNRQGYTCNRNTVFAGDSCLGDDGGFSSSPSRLGLGARVTPWLEGLSFTGAVEIGTGATSDFLEEVAPEPPWQLYFGLGYHYDTERKATEVQTKTVEVERVVELPPPQENYIEGTVVEKGTTTPIPEALVKYDGRDITGMISSAAGKFETRNLEPGTYTFKVTAEGYREGTCQGTIMAPMPAQPQPGFTPGAPGAPPPGFQPAPAPGAPAPGAPAPGQPAQPSPFGSSITPESKMFVGQPGVGQPAPQPGFGQPAPGQPTQPGFGGPPPGQPGQPTFGGPPPGQPGQPGFGGPQAPAPNVVKITCELEALPKVGNVVGSLIDAENAAPIGEAKVKITDKLNRELELAADAGGAFRFENVPPGKVLITVEKEGYLRSVTEIEVRVREDVQARIRLNKRPKRGKVLVTARELKLRDKIHFATNSSNITPDSMALVQEIADVLQRRAEIQEVEIQGHTDNTGSAPYNMRLSQQRADSVRQELIRLGVDTSRLSAKGYGQEKPLLPNVSDANRARNRRVQLIIKKKGKP